MGKFSKLTIGFVINFFLTNNFQQRRKEDAEMKGWSRIAGKTLSVLFLCAALALGGCGQGAPDVSSGTPSSAAPETSSSRRSAAQDPGKLSFTPSTDPEVIEEKVEEALAIVNEYIRFGERGVFLGSELLWYLNEYGGEEGKEALDKAVGDRDTIIDPNPTIYNAMKWAGTDAESYRMTRGEDTPSRLMLILDAQPTFGSPFGSKITEMAAWQLVWVITTVQAGPCPFCDCTTWALVNLGKMDAEADEIRWMSVCELITYENVQRSVLTYPLWVKPGVMVETEGGHLADASTLGVARGERSSLTEIVHVTWPGGYSCDISEEFLITPDPETVNAATGEDFSWEDLFPG